ncbi:relaxase/mobilization nuclease domain-containing protein [Aeromicrobium massiliense]|uniref:relaxase/mobilization nuclease domain-containing protein n=1 Tax=Aeromicrobium massiliense TaxID=1464554 RepID=UPI0002EBF22B|nr:relaxase/mobilization nuclease domain-containing protein [Aeromicrobium massiliense]
MIPNVVKGGDMRGLLRYLAGPGRENEHTNPHVIGGDDFLLAWHGSEELNADAAGEISDYLEQPRQHWGTEIRSQVTAVDPETDERVVVGYRDQHVWHCSLSLPVDDRTVSDDEWRAIASDFMDEMGFTEASGKAPARWVAIHHGTSKRGNDHIHIAASMVREDGTRWDGRYGDYRRAQEACRSIERKYGLAAVAGREAGLGARGAKPAELAQAERAGMPHTAPVELAHRIRSAAVASQSEDEWIRRVRKAGVVLKPYYAKGTTDVVTGYKAALKPEDYNERLVFYGGGRLGKDLSLPRVREHFAEPTLESSAAAAAEWTAAAKGQAPALRGGPDDMALTPQAPVNAARWLADFNDQLKSIPLGDDVAWSDAARDVSGALSAWARFDTENRDELNAAAEQVARSAQVRRAGVPHRRPSSSTLGAAVVLLQTRTDGKGKVAGTLMARQVFGAVKALHDRQVAMKHLAEAEVLRTRALERLQRIPLTGYGDETSAPVAVAADLKAAGERATAQKVAEAQRGTRPEPGDPVKPPLPNQLGPQRSRQRTGRAGRDQGHGR